MDTIKLRKGRSSNNIPTRVNLAAWYRYHIGMTNVGGFCSSWADQSGNGRDLVQATASARPVILSDGSLQFDGANDFLQAAFTLPQPLTIYLAFMQLSWTSGDVIFSGATAEVQVAQNTSSPGLAANAGSGLTVSNTIPVNARGVCCFVANGTSSVYQAGGGSFSVTTTGSGGANAAGGFTLGADSSEANWSNIRVFEAAIFSVAHDANTRLQLLRYMARQGQVGGV